MLHTNPVTITNIPMIPPNTLPTSLTFPPCFFQTMKLKMLGNINITKLPANELVKLITSLILFMKEPITPVTNMIKRQIENLQNVGESLSFQNNASIVLRSPKHGNG